MTVINLCSPTFKPAESYGRIALELGAEFARMELTVNQIGGQGLDAPKTVFRPAIGGILLGYPTLWEFYTPLVHKGVRVAVTMFESTVLPQGWVERLNQADGVVVPATWLVDVFRQNGVTKPIRVAPLGISEVFCQPKRREVSDPFTFIAFADRGYRKGWFHAAQAFSQAFGKSIAYRLILKTRDAYLKKLITNPNIEVVTDEMDDKGLLELYHQCHVMLAPNCSEGFGFIPREFAASGGVAAATNRGGTADDLQWWGVPIPYTLDKAWLDDEKWRGQLGQWAEPDVDGLARLMKHMVAQYEVYQDAALRSAGYVASHYTWSRFAKQVYGFYQELAEARFGSDRQRENAVPA